MHTDARGMTLVEILMALVILAIGIFALARVLPSSSHSEVGARMQDTAGQYANEEFESLRGLPRNSSSLSTGRHPASGFDSLGTRKALTRYYVVIQMASPLDSLFKVKSTVRWKSAKPESVVVIGYLMP